MTTNTTMTTNATRSAERRSAGAADAAGPFNGRVSYYHPNRQGTGAAVRFELKLGREPREKCIFLEMAPQAGGTGGDDERGNGKRFDWARKATVKLGFLDVCEFLAVLEGRRSQLGDRGGLYHAAGEHNTLIALKTNTERPGYTLALSRKHRDGTAVFKGHVVLSEAEAIGLRCVFQSALFYLAYQDSLLSRAGWPAAN